VRLLIAIAYAAILFLAVAVGCSLAQQRLDRRRIATLEHGEGISVHTVRPSRTPSRGRFADLAKRIRQWRKKKSSSQ
jgi:hypothetical protein